jgi:predicted dehydrogenase
MSRKLKMGMVGGGKDAFIGAVHRLAANLDGRIELVAGAFSSNPAKSHESGALLLLDPKRVYDSYEAMAEAEAKLPVGQRIDFVSIVTPNFAHFPAAKTFLEAGFNVVCDKPVTLDLEEALKLREVVQRSGNSYLSDAAKRFTRLPFGHPEAFIEAFANVYLEAARAIEAEVTGQPVPEGLDFPTVEDGVEGMAFITAAVQSAKGGAVWTKMPAV